MCDIHFFYRTKVIEIKKPTSGDNWISCGSKEIFDNYNEKFIFFFKDFTVRYKSIPDRGPISLGIRNNCTYPSSEIVPLGKYGTNLSISISFCSESKKINFLFIHVFGGTSSKTADCPDNLCKAVKCQNMLTN